MATTGTGENNTAKIVPFTMILAVLLSPNPSVLSAPKASFALTRDTQTITLTVQLAITALKASKIQSFVTKVPTTQSKTPTKQPTASNALQANTANCKVWTSLVETVTKVISAPSCHVRKHLVLKI